MVPTDLERDGQPSIYRAEADGFVLDLNREDALVVVHAGAFEAARAFPFALPDPGDRPYRKVGAQTELSTNVLVGQLLQRELGEVLLRPRHFQNKVARGSKPVNRAAQALRLTREGMSLQRTLSRDIFVILLHMQHADKRLSPPQNSSHASRQGLPSWSSCEVDRMLTIYRH